jgi:hypothetical protein
MTQSACEENEDSRFSEMQRLTKKLTNGAAAQPTGASMGTYLVHLVLFVRHHCRRDTIPPSMPIDSLEQLPSSSPSCLHRNHSVLDEHLLAAVDCLSSLSNLTVCDHLVEIRDLFEVLDDEI